MNFALRRIQSLIDKYKKENPNESVGELSDTYHSFNDLYKHRTVLFAAFIASVPYSWKTRKHEDGSMYDGMFVAGCPTPDGMISYHIDNEYWDLFKIPVLEHAPHFTGYTPDDVIERLAKYAQSMSFGKLSPAEFAAINAVAMNEIMPIFKDDTTAKLAYIAFFQS